MDPVSLATTALSILREIHDAMRAVEVHRKQTTRLVERAARFQVVLRRVKDEPGLHAGTRLFLEPLIEQLKRIRDFVSALGSKHRLRQMLEHRRTTDTFRELNGDLTVSAIDLNVALGLERNQRAGETPNDQHDREDDLKDLFDQLIELSKEAQSRQGQQHQELIEQVEMLKTMMRQLHAAVPGAMNRDVAAVLATREQQKPAFELMQEHRRVLLNHYEKHDLALRSTVMVGEGSFGKVFRANCALGVVAIKQLRVPRGATASPHSNDKVLEELLAQARVQCENVVRVYGFMKQSVSATGSGGLCLVLKYARHGSLKQILDACTVVNGIISVRRGDGNTSSQLLTKGVILMLLLDIACGLEFIHSQCIIHRDLKPGNVLMGEGFRAKIADFGLSKLVMGSAGRHTAGPGSVGYMAPEIHQAPIWGGRAPYTYTADIFSFGVLLHELCRQPYISEINACSSELPAAFPAAMTHIRKRCL